MMFNENYWLASRCIKTTSDIAVFSLRYVGPSNVYYDHLSEGKSLRMYNFDVNYCKVRPVVTIKSNVIDLDTIYETEGTWKLK